MFRKLQHLAIQLLLHDNHLCVGPFTQQDLPDASYQGKMIFQFVDYIESIGICMTIIWIYAIFSMCVWPYISAWQLLFACFTGYKACTSSVCWWTPSFGRFSLFLQEVKTKYNLHTNLSNLLPSAQPYRIYGKCLTLLSLQKNALQPLINPLLNGLPGYIYNSQTYYLNYSLVCFC